MPIPEAAIPASTGEVVAIPVPLPPWAGVPGSPGAALVAVPASLPPWTGGGGAGGSGFQHNQTTPSASWTIPHSLGRLPNVQIYVAGKMVLADVESSSTLVTITFASAQSGVAVLT